MSYQKLSFFTLVFFFPLAFYTQIDAMENDVTQAIEKKLLILDAAIIETANQLKLAEAQKNKDQEIYKGYVKRYQQEYKNAGWSFCPFNYEAPEVKNYKGDFIYNIESYNPNFAVYTNTGSDAKWITLQKSLETKKAAHRNFKDELKRAKRLGDTEYLKDVEKEIQDYLTTLKNDEIIQISQ
ncbi:MAG TPA: hypothetical protein VKU36_04890 [Candidatus Babeliales bacterium]|nr:hypothetical protein [Candidatus Babeliales bacterium]